MYVYENYEHKTAPIQRNQFNSIQKSQNQDLKSLARVNLLQAVVEGFVDGILILNSQRNLVHINESARYVFKQLNQGINQPQEIPREIWKVCESLIESRELFPEDNISIESEILANRTFKLRIRARWLTIAGGSDDFLLVTLEDRYQTRKSIAIADAKKYGLTNRETEVWLLRRENFSYQEIADRLYITINTVKKHLKSIYAKQQQEMVYLQA
ncbi:MAG: helix-turn-helix transcriptional regulator [Cyanobacteria bacterium P01_A01_bin.84]